MAFLLAWHTRTMVLAVPVCPESGFRKRAARLRGQLTSAGYLMPNLPVLADCLLPGPSLRWHVDGVLMVSPIVVVKSA